MRLIFLPSAGLAVRRYSIRAGAQLAAPSTSTGESLTRALPPTVGKCKSSTRAPRSVLGHRAGVFKSSRLFPVSVLGTSGTPRGALLAFIIHVNTLRKLLQHSGFVLKPSFSLFIPPPLLNLCVHSDFTLRREYKHQND